MWHRNSKQVAGGHCEVHCTYAPYLKMELSSLRVRRVQTSNRATVQTSVHLNSQPSTAPSGAIMTYVGQTIDATHLVILNLWTSLRRHPSFLRILHIQIPRLLAVFATRSRRRWIHPTYGTMPQTKRVHNMADDSTTTRTRRARSILAECR